MALIKCRECGTEYSNNASACIKCGNPNNPELKSWLDKKYTTWQSIRIGFYFIVFSLATFGLIESCNKKTESTSGVATEKSEYSKNVDTVNAYLAPSKFKPEMVVKLAGDKGGFACISKEALNEALGHAARNEITKFKGMFDTMDCVSISNDQNLKFKILSVDHHEVEFVTITANVSEGMWSTEETFEPI